MISLTVVVVSFLVIFGGLFLIYKFHKEELVEQRRQNRANPRSHSRPSH
jgi:hypothetical protein